MSTTEKSFNHVSGTESTLVCGLTPSGRIEVRPGLPEDGPALSTAASDRILAAFELGRGNGVLHLGAAEPGTNFHPTLAYWRNMGSAFVARVCGALDPTDPKSLIIPDPDSDEIAAWVDATPPMQGAELITHPLLKALWWDMGHALTAEAQNDPDGVQGYLKKRSSIWNVVGRVCLHLAENKRDPKFPFAFIATYIHKVSSQAMPQHLPLGQALKEYAKNRQKLLALLSPLSRAAEQSPFIREMVDAGDIYHPLSWTPKEAYTFLSEIALYEQSGLVVRMPDWWNPKARPRPRVSMTVGSQSPSTLGIDALMDFDVKLTVAGNSLSEKEIEEIMASTEGLVLIKGKWVEVDRDQLSHLLDHWRDLQRKAQAGGIRFGEAMRLLAGARLDDNRTQGAQYAPPEWSDVIAGKWLSSKIDALRSPQWQYEIDAHAGLRTELRPYQKIGVQWLNILRGMELGGCLADDMGLGKTLQVLGILSLCLHRKERGTDLLVVPASIIDNWRLEINRFAPTALSVLIAHPSKISSTEIKQLSNKKVETHHLVITTYGTVMRTDWMKSYPWRNVILDEAQAIKSPDAKQTRAVKALSSQWRLALTGTPVENRLGDLWSLFDFLNPGLLGSAKMFGNFGKSLAAGPQGYAPLRKLVQPYILRRLKTDKNVITDLPDKTEMNAFCMLSKRQAALYQQSVNAMKEAIATLTGIERRGVVLAFLMRLKQICNHPSHWLGDGAFDPSDSGKFARLSELCEPIASRQDKVLVFSQFREMIEPLARFMAHVFGRSGLVLHGNTPVKERQKRVQSFQENDRVPFMVLSLKAGGVGLNLTAASHVIHFDRWWNPAVENQATDRAFRIGQKKNVLVHKFVCRGTVEERIDEMIASKQKLSEEVLSGGAEAALTEMSNEELFSMVSLDLRRALEGEGGGVNDE